MLEKTLESPLECKKIQPVHSEGDQSWVFIGRTDAEAETPILWPPHAKSWLIGKDFDAGRDWEQEDKGTTEDETAGWHHQLDGHEFEWTPGDGDGQAPLKLNIQKTKIMASGPITSWELDGETVSDFIFLGSKITADGDCSHEIKRRLLLGIKLWPT